MGIFSILESSNFDTLTLKTKIMKVYDSFGTFNSVIGEFNLAGQTTNIGTDNYVITAYYDISNTTRFAVLAILQTVNGNKNNLRDYPADCAFLVNNIDFDLVNTNYLTPADKNLKEAGNSDIIHVIVHHGIGFDPTTNPADNMYIINYKAETYTYYSKGSQPGRGGKGHLGI